MENNQQACLEIHLKHYLLSKPAPIVSNTDKLQDTGVKVFTCPRHPSILDFDFHP